MPSLWITPADLDEPTSPYAEDAVEAASLLLYKLTGEKFTGTHLATEWYGIRTSGQYACHDVLNGVDARHPFFYSENANVRFRLRGRPVISVDLVEDADGSIVPSEAYTLANRAILARIDGKRWNLARGITVTYRYGVNPPVQGKLAAIALANEYVLMWSGSSDCSLPDHVTSVSRQGLTFSLSQPDALFAARQTGIWEVDSFIAAFNAEGARKRPRIFLPDAPRGETRI